MTPRDPAAVRLATRIFAAAAALPRATSRRFAADVRQAFRDDAIDAYRTGGIRRLTGATAAALADLTRRPRRPRRARPGFGFTHDLRYAVRSIESRFGFWAAAVLMLSVGIGGNAAVFSLVSAALLRPLPYPESDRLVWVSGAKAGDAASVQPVNPADAIDWDRGASAIDGLGLWTTAPQTLIGAGDPMAIPIGIATSSLFHVLRVTPVLGRTFGPEHDVAGRETDVLITHGFWRRVFNSDPHVVGRTVRLAGVSCTVIGVLPPGFLSPGVPSGQEPQVWRPLVVAPGNRGGHFASAVARLAPGATLSEAQAQVEAVALDLERRFAVTNTGQRARLEPLQQAIAGDVRPVFLMLMAAVGLVLIIACANVANLLLAQAATRRREVALRSALGGTRWRIARQLLTESLLLAGIAAPLGVAIAAALLGALPPWLMDQLPSTLHVTLDARVIGFTMAVSLLTVLSCGMMPAIITSRVDLRRVLTEHSAGGGNRSHGMQSALVIAETALAVVLLVAAAQLTQSLNALHRVDPGFNADSTLTFRLSLPQARYPGAAARRSFFTGFDERVRSLPGVVASGAVNTSPLSGRYSCDSFALADRPAPPAGQEPCAEVRVATPGYFDAMGIPRLHGRHLERADDVSAQRVATISESMARRYWPDGGALGQRFKWGDLQSSTPWITIVGVVGDIRHFGLDQAATDDIYMPFQQSPPSSLTFAVRTAEDAMDVAATVRAIAREADPELPVSEVLTTEQIVARSVSMPVFRTGLLGAFALLALALTTMGVYGLMAFDVVQRRREIGIRLALGAGPSRVRRFIIARGLSRAALGCALGLLACVPLTWALQSLLFGVSATDPAAYVVAVAIVVLVSLVASYVPARRASGVSPVETIAAQ